MPIAAIYARYSSDNQRVESIEDQISSCRQFASVKGWTVDERYIFTDKAMSGARNDRPALQNMMKTAAEGEEFQVLVVDDLSRLARDNLLMLELIARRRYHGVRVVAVADGLDSGDEEANLGIQLRGIINEVYLRDLKNKTMCGMRGQKARGFFVGERTFGYRSIPVGELRADKKGRMRPDGYKKEVNPPEATIIKRIFQEFADRKALTRLAKDLNLERIPGPSQNAT